MTVKEIAELCGVKEVKTIYNWIDKIESLSVKITLRNKVDNGSPEKPADFTLEETLAIIGDGGKNKTLAALLEENAANKNALVAVNNRSTELQEYIERIIDEKIQKVLQQRNLIVKTPKLLENKYKKEQAFYDFVNKYIYIAPMTFPIKQIEVWEDYTETTKKANRMTKKEFFQKLSTIFPRMNIKKAREGPYFQYFCYGINLKEN